MYTLNLDNVSEVSDVSMPDEEQQRRLGLPIVPTLKPKTSKYSSDALERDSSLSITKQNVARKSTTPKTDNLRRNDRDQSRKENKMLPQTVSKSKSCGDTSHNYKTSKSSKPKVNQEKQFDLGSELFAGTNNSSVSTKTSKIKDIISKKPKPKTHQISTPPNAQKSDSVLGSILGEMAKTLGETSAEATGEASAALAKIQASKTNSQEKNIRHQSQGGNQQTKNSGNVISQTAKSREERSRDSRKQKDVRKVIVKESSASRTSKDLPTTSNDVCDSPQNVVVPPYEDHTISVTSQPIPSWIKSILPKTPANKRRKRRVTFKEGRHLCQVREIEHNPEERRNRDLPKDPSYDRKDIGRLPRRQEPDNTGGFGAKFRDPLHPVNSNRPTNIMEKLPGISTYKVHEHVTKYL